MSQRFCLFFFEKRGELFEKNKQKTRFVKHAYPVFGGVNFGASKGTNVVLLFAGVKKRVGSVTFGVYFSSQICKNIVSSAYFCLLLQSGRQKGHLEKNF